MSSNNDSTQPAPLDLTKWRSLPMKLIVIGGIGAVIGLAVGGPKQFAFSWLLAFMFCLSICVGGWFLTMVHHLFDASWSVPTRRYCEHLACLLGFPMIPLFLPIAILAKQLYPWLSCHPAGKPESRRSFQISAVHVAGILHFGGDHVWHLVALFKSPSVLVAQAG